MARIALVTTSLSAFVREHGAMIASRGHDVTIIGPDRQTRPGESLLDSFYRTEPGVESRRLQVRSFRPLWPDGWPSLLDGHGAPDQLEHSRWLWVEVPSIVTAMANALWRRRRAFDAVVAHWLLPAGLVAATASPHLPVLTIAHGADAHLIASLPKPFQRAIMRRLLRPGIRLVATSNDLVRTLTQGLGTRMRKDAIQRFSVLPMGIDVEAIEAQTSINRQEARKRLGLRPTGPVALFMGRLVPVKNPMALIDLARSIEDISILVAGTGPLEAALRQAVHRHRLAHRIHLVGWADQDLKSMALRAADFAVLPSIRLTSGRTESSPVVLAEAMAAGLPVVASRVGGVDQSVIHGTNGFLVKPGKLTELVHATQQLINDSVLRRFMSNEARRSARQRDWPGIVSCHLDLLSQAAAELDGPFMTNTKWTL